MIHRYSQAVPILFIDTGSVLVGGIPQRILQDQHENVFDTQQEINSLGAHALLTFEHLRGVSITTLLQ